MFTCRCWLLRPSWAFPAALTLGVATVALLCFAPAVSFGDTAPPNQYPVVSVEGGGGDGTGGGGSGRGSVRLGIGSLVGLIGQMERDLSAAGLPGVETGVNLGEPVIQTEPTMQGESWIILSDEFGPFAGGTAVVTVDSVGREVRAVVEITEDAVTRTFEQTVWGIGQTLFVRGTITFEDGTALSGGWTYSAAEGVVEDGDCDPGFSDEVAAMFHVGYVGGGGAAPVFLALEDLLTLIGNILKMIVNYILDAFIPYEPPESCDGPIIEGSCEPGDVYCQDDIAGFCEAGIDDIPGVSNAFKKCMKGRCGCGGSTFPRTRITCADSSDCGPCAAFGNAGGCNIAGATVWYCDATDDPCECANVVFHEMSHACGALDDPNCDTSQLGVCSADFEDFTGACRVGFFFQDVCCDGPVVP